MVKKKNKESIPEKANFIMHKGNNTIVIRRNVGSIFTHADPISDETRQEIMKKCLLIFQMMISSNKTHLLQDEMSEVECMDNKHRQNEYSETLE